MNTIFGLVGKSGFGREVMPLVTSSNNSGFGTRYFLDSDTTEAEVGGMAVLTEEQFCATEADKRYFNVAIADYKLREKIASNLLGVNCVAQSIIAEQSIMLERVDLGEGAIICSYSHITSDAQIGRFFHMNIYSYVAHDCKIGDFVTFAPRVSCNGCVHIDDYAYIGTGAVLRQGTPEKPLKIGKGAVVGMGAVVTKDVEPFATVIGNPAKPMVKRPAS